MIVVNAARSFEVLIMQTAFSVTGTLEGGRIVHLDEELPINSGKVRLIVEAVEPRAATGGAEFEAMLRARQHARGHQPRTKEQIDEHLREERDSWDN